MFSQGRVGRIIFSQEVESTLPTTMFDATVSIVLTGKRSTPMSAPTTVAVSLEVRIEMLFLVTSNYCR